jgi:predicted nucleic acid-binding protein
LSFDLPRALRRLRPQRRVTSIERRERSQLTYVTLPASAGAELLIDSCVYIDVLQARAPEAVKALIGARIVNHSSVCLGELTHLFGRLDRAHRGTKAALNEIRRVVQDIPDHRLTTPSETAMGEAGMLAGLVSRLTGAPRAEAPALFNDACIYLHAIERGWTILTRNVRDFDLFNQLLPTGRVLLYETA